MSIPKIIKKIFIVPKEEFEKVKIDNDDKPEAFSMILLLAGGFMIWLITEWLGYSKIFNSDNLGVLLVISVIMTSLYLLDMIISSVFLGPVIKFIARVTKRKTQKISFLKNLRIMILSYNTMIFIPIIGIFSMIFNFYNISKGISEVYEISLFKGFLVTFVSGFARTVFMFPAYLIINYYIITMLSVA